jgi:hypothetical protein
MGKTNDLGVTTKERAWAEGNRGKKRVKKKLGPMAYRRRRRSPPARNLHDASEQSEIISEPRLFFEGLK